MNSAELSAFDALDWVDRYFDGQSPLQYDQLQPVLGFSIIWNLFETTACSRNANPSAIRRSVDKADQAGQLDPEKYTKFVQYFRDRYLTNASIEEAFAQLLMTHRESRVLVQRVLNDETSDLNNIVYALLLIAHRIRNNLFHGNKSVSSLPQQTDLFRVVNRLLAEYLEDIAPGRVPPPVTADA